MWDLCLWSVLSEDWGGLWNGSWGKRVECSEIDGMFCGSLDTKNTVRGVDSGGLAREVSEGSKVSI